MNCYMLTAWMSAVAPNVDQLTTTKVYSTPTSEIHGPAYLQTDTDELLTTATYQPNISHQVDTTPAGFWPLVLLHAV